MLSNTDTNKIRLNLFEVLDFSDRKDLYLEQDIKIFNQSMRVVMGIIHAETKKQHSIERKSDLQVALVVNLIAIGGLFEVPKLAFLTAMSALYDRVNPSGKLNEKLVEELKRVGIC